MLGDFLGQVTSEITAARRLRKGLVLQLYFHGKKKLIKKLRTIIDNNRCGHLVILASMFCEYWYIAVVVKVICMHRIDTFIKDSCDLCYTEK